MKLPLVIAIVVALGLALAAWFFRGSPMFAGAARAIGVRHENATPDAAATFKAAGVHKCVGAHGTSYIDGPCPAGMREAAASGGTVTVTSFPKPAPAAASSALGGPIVKPMDPDE
ncbi:MAG TPA: hypothetical protein VIN75_11900, partial [Burkholderiaceae bacterium]